MGSENQIWRQLSDELAEAETAAVSSTQSAATANMVLNVTARGRVSDGSAPRHHELYETLGKAYGQASNLRSQ